MLGVADLDTGYVSLDIHRVWGVELTDATLNTRTWRWLMARAMTLLDMHDSLTHRKALDVV